MTGSATASENQVIVDLAEESAARRAFPIVSGKILGVVINEGQELASFDLTEYQSNPDRQTGRVSLTDSDSFVGYVNRHRDDNRTTVWSNVDQGTVTAVLNDHIQDGPEAGWADHRATLQLKLTEDWKFWAKNDGKLLSQGEFAEHLEEGALNIRIPAAADMLEIASSFQAKKGVAFKSSTRLDSGEVGLQYEETIEAKSGRKGSIEIPQQFTLVLQPFDGGPEFEVVALVPLPHPRRRARARLQDHPAGPREAGRFQRDHRDRVRGHQPARPGWHAP
jgi:uncharacterized protein YfdQ (DUF2303 family)